MKKLLVVIAVIIFGASCNTISHLQKKETKEIEKAEGHTLMALHYYYVAERCIDNKRLDSVIFCERKLKKYTDKAKKHLDKAEKYQKLIYIRINKLPINISDTQ